MPVADGTWAETFAGWRIDSMERAEVPSDTRPLEVIIARLASTRP